MSRENLKEYLSTHKDKIIRIGCYSAGIIVICVVWRKAIKRRNNYIVTDLVVSDLGNGCGANDKVLRWEMDFAKM